MMQRTPLAHAPVTKIEVAYAGFWRRLLAFLVDWTVLGTVGGILSAGVVLMDPGDHIALSNAMWISVVIGWAYYALLESSPARGTLGKIAFEVFVGDLHGDPITFWRASARYWLKILSSLLLMTGWLMAAFTPRKQALHDVLAGTLVLRKVRFQVIGQEIPTEPGEYWDGTRWVATVTQLERS